MEEDERLLFSEAPRNFFKEILSKTSWEELQKYSGVSGRTLRAWRAGETSMPASIARDWSNKYRIELPRHSILFLNETRRQAGIAGGKMRQKMWGNPGTPDGRVLGGKRAIESHKKNLQSPFVSKSISLPELSIELAELFGIILGDGTITNYQFILFSNSLDEAEYAVFLTELVRKLFGFTPVIIFSPKKNVIHIISSRKNAVEYLVKLGLSKGNKVKHQVDVPDWIKENQSYSDACLRGLIDTDGCVYLDSHKINEKYYSSQCISFTNASVPLLNFVESRFKALGFHPTRSGRDIRLRKKTDVLRYAKEIGFSNPKHAQKIRI
jgi:intein/homing endonuclease